MTEAEPGSHNIRIVSVFFLVLFLWGMNYLALVASQLIHFGDELARYGQFVISLVAGIAFLKWLPGDDVLATKPALVGMAAKAAVVLGAWGFGTIGLFQLANILKIDRVKAEDLRVLKSWTSNAIPPGCWATAQNNNYVSWECDSSVKDVASFFRRHLSRDWHQVSNQALKSPVVFRKGGAQANPMDEIEIYNYGVGATRGVGFTLRPARPKYPWSKFGI